MRALLWALVLGLPQGALATGYRDASSIVSIGGPVTEIVYALGAGDRVVARDTTSQFPEAVQALPPGCTHLVASAPCPFQMIRYGKNVYATQFHPEADTKVFEARIHIYKDHGYFRPEEAMDLIEALQHEDIHMPELILGNFVTRFGQ